MRKNLFKCVAIFMTAVMLMTSADLTAFAAEPDNGLLLDEAAVDLGNEAEEETETSDSGELTEDEIVENDGGVYIHESNLSDSERIAAAQAYADNMLAEGIESGLSDQGEYTHPLDKEVSWELYNNGLLYVHGDVGDNLYDHGSTTNAGNGYWGENHQADVKKILYEVDGRGDITFEYLTNVEEIGVSPKMDAAKIESLNIGCYAPKLKKIRMSFTTSDKLKYAYFSSSNQLPALEEIILDGVINNSFAYMGTVRGDCS
ncbi:MAG: hypothetical protein MJ119_03945, partial [Lachnospiraceae bacterium]|nr:hypothetical protein [Lachnospiraceae bacterium]